MLAIQLTRQIIAISGRHGGLDALDFPVQAVGPDVRQAAGPGPAGDRAVGLISDAGKQGLTVHADGIDFAMGISVADLVAAGGGELGEKVAGKLCRTRPHFFLAKGMLQS
jgi:hypothetical protein